MDIKKLSQFNVNDLKKIDLKQLVEVVKSRPEIFINILLIAGTIYATIYFYNSVQEQSESLTANVSSAEAKMKVVDEYKKVEKQYAEVKEKFPKSISSDEFLAKLSDLALKNNVQTVSFSQPQKKSGEYVDLVVINFNILSENYGNLLTFLKDIETFPNALRLHKLTAHLVDSSSDNRRNNQGQYQYQNKNQNQNQNHEQGQNYIEVNLEIGLVNLKK